MKILLIQDYKLVEVLQEKLGNEYLVVVTDGIDEPIYFKEV